MNNHSIQVKTSYNNDIIEQELITQGQPVKGAVKDIIKLKDRGVREVLIRLGWTPPPSEPGVMMRFCDLPVGARFKYPTGDDVWVVIEPYQNGLVARWTGVNEDRQRQCMCSFVDDNWTLESEVEVLV